MIAVHPPEPAPGSSPVCFPLDIDLATGGGGVVELSEADYRDASFLDARLLAAGKALRQAAPEALRALAVGLPLHCHFVFHIGHVGSTLVSRLIGEHPDLFALREPAALRTLAAAEASLPAARLESFLDTLLRLYSRTWRPHQTSAIKVTSFVSELAPSMLTCAPQGRGLLIMTSPLAYLRTIFGGEASQAEAARLAEARLARLHRRLGAAPWSAAALSPGETIAMSWLSEMAALGDIARRAPERTRLVNFDRFLDEPATGLGHMFRHLGADADPQIARTIVQGPILTRYSKGPEHAYDGALRARVAQQAQARHGREIDRGMRWLGQAATRFPLVLGVLEQAAKASR